MRKSLVWVAGVSLAAIAFSSGTASAQTAAAGASEDTATPTTTDQNEIVVTAQGRAQQLADVPVAISAVNA